MKSRLLNLIKNIGILGAVVYLFQSRIQKIFKTHRPYRLILKNCRHAVFCRSGTSDLHVFHQIFVEDEYRCVNDASNVDLIVDCGANIGLSSVYFLNHFPQSFVIAVEPVPDNFRMMERNLKPYQDRVKMLNSAIWSHSAPLTISESKYRDGAEWSHQVRECKTGEAPLFWGLDIGQILKESGRTRISILKIDIEGAEGIVFSHPGYKNWIDKVDTILIEIHDDSSFGKCSDIFFSATKGHFDYSRCGELTVCKRKTKV